MAGIMITIQWMGGKEFRENEGAHECNSCLHKESCGYIGREGELMNEDITDGLGMPLVLLCNGWLPKPSQKTQYVDPHSEQSRRRILDELRAVKQGRDRRQQKVQGN